MDSCWEGQRGHPRSSAWASQLHLRNNRVLLYTHETLKHQPRIPSLATRREFYSVQSALCIRWDNSKRPRARTRTSKLASLGTGTYLCHLRKLACSLWRNCCPETTRIQHQHALHPRSRSHYHRLHLLPSVSQAHMMLFLNNGVSSTVWRHTLFRNPSVKQSYILCLPLPTLSEYASFLWPFS